MPYSPLAGGHLCYTGWESASRRSATDMFLRKKYDQAHENDLEVIQAVADVACEKGVSMAEVALAWHYAKGVASPIVGGTRAEHLASAARAVELVLSADDVARLEAPYRAHEVVGAL